MHHEKPKGGQSRQVSAVALGAVVLGALVAQIAVAGGSGSNEEKIASLQRQITALKAQSGSPATIAKKKTKRGPRGLQGPQGPRGEKGEPGEPGLGSGPAVHVTRTGPQTFQESVPASIAFDAERYDTAAMHDNATNSTRLTAPVAGVYAIWAEVEWAGIAGGGLTRELKLMKNASVPVALAREICADGADTVYASCALPIAQDISSQALLQAGDFIEVRAEQVGFGLDTVDVLKVNETSPELSMTWLAPGP